MHCPFVSRFVKMEQALGSLNARGAPAGWHGWCPVPALGPAAVQHCRAAHCLRVQQQFFICLPQQQCQMQMSTHNNSSNSNSNHKKQWNINCKRKIEERQAKRRERTRKFCLCWVNLSCVRYILFTKCKCYLQSLKLKQIYTHPTNTTLSHIHTHTRRHIKALQA